MGEVYDYLSSQNQLANNDPSKEEWLLAGLIHDIDYSGEYKTTHPLKTKEVLEKYGLELPEKIGNIIQAHAPKITQRYPKNKAEWAIFCADSLTGLIVAVALVYPSKKLADVKPSSVRKKFLKSPHFAAGTRRDEVKMCENKNGLNIPLNQFIEICLTAMKRVAPKIGL